MLQCYTLLISESTLYTSGSQSYELYYASWIYEHAVLLFKDAVAIIKDYKNETECNVSRLNRQGMQTHVTTRFYMYYIPQCRDYEQKFLLEFWFGESKLSPQTMHCESPNYDVLSLHQSSDLPEFQPCSTYRVDWCIIQAIRNYVALTPDNTNAPFGNKVVSKCSNTHWHHVDESLLPNINYHFFRQYIDVWQRVIILPIHVIFSDSMAVSQR